MNIDALSSIEVHLESNVNQDEIWKILKGFSVSWSDWRESYSDSFPDDDLLDSMDKLVGELLVIKSGRKLRDMFDLKILMTEQGHQRIIKTDNDLDNATSDGLKYLAICIIYIAISRLLCPDRSVALHWPIDELGILHGDNIAKLFAMLDQSGIIMVAGFPSNDPNMLVNFKHRQLIDFKKGVRILQIPSLTLRDRVLEKLEESKS